MAGAEQTLTRAPSSRQRFTRPPWMVGALVIHLVYNSLAPFIAAVGSWADTGCGLECESWAGLHYMHLAGTGTALVVGALGAFGIWRRNRFVWAIVLAYCLLAILPTTNPWLVMLGATQSYGPMYTLILFKLSFIALLLWPSVLRWCWRKPKPVADHDSI